MTTLQSKLDAILQRIDLKKDLRSMFDLAGEPRLAMRQFVEMEYLFKSKAVIEAAIERTN